MTQSTETDKSQIENQNGENSEKKSVKKASPKAIESKKASKKNTDTEIISDELSEKSEAISVEEIPNPVIAKDKSTDDIPEINPDSNKDEVPEETIEEKAETKEVVVPEPELKIESKAKVKKEPKALIEEKIVEIKEEIVEKSIPDSVINQVEAEEVIEEGDAEKPDKEDDSIDSKDKKQKKASKETIVEVPEINKEELEAEYHTFSTEKLIELIEELVQNDDINEIKTKVSLIKVAYLKKIKEEKKQKFQTYIDEGGEEEVYTPEINPLENRFKAAFEIYKLKKSKFIEEQEKLKLENLEIKKQILEELKELINSEESLKKTYDEFKDLQDKWKNVGMVPKNEINNLWQSYHFLVEKFFDKVKINNELRDLDLKKNLELKIELCEKAEELLLETSIIKSFKELQKHHDKWKEIGPVPQEKKDEIWERFKSASDKINQRRREYYEKVQDEQLNNLSAKLALCEKIEEVLNKEITSIKIWQEKTDEVDELLKIWKTIGSVPKANNEEIWERFKTSMNTFYANKKEFFNEIKDEQVNNYNLKLDICAEAESLKDSSDWKNTSNQLIKLQQNWKNIGPVPRKFSDKIWKRFRSACDEFFNRKADYFKNIDVHEKNNMQAKLDIIKRVEQLEFSGTKNENLKIIKEIQREWTETGHVPINEKQKLQKQFRAVIEKRLEELKISAVEISTMSFKSKFENISSTSEGKNSIYKEKIYISNKISKLKNDITLWENNMGFFANSKKADILKEEFEKKIQVSKNELLILEAKLKYLSSI
ncbi:MAG: DUF349 domain-containing protein [Saprospiraceae bacterium]|nr:DUF349 domain-containing protein [Saprospiraceae bacterium]